MTNEPSRTLQQFLEDLPVMPLDLLRLSLSFARDKAKLPLSVADKAENDQWLAAMEAELKRRDGAGA